MYYKNFFSAVVESSSLKIIFAIAPQNKLLIKTLNVKTEFLHGQLDEEIFIKVPKGYKEKDKI